MFVDGAYFREIILNELTPVDRIYVARPINYKWLGPLPTNYADLEDFKTKLNFNGTYDGERHQIHLINKLFRDGALKRAEPDADTQIPGDFSGRNEAGTAGYHPIDLIEVEIEIQRGYHGLCLRGHGGLRPGLRGGPCGSSASTQAESSFRITTSTAYSPARGTVKMGQASGSPPGPRSGIVHEKAPADRSPASCSS